jgi:hypothetical protein
LLVAFLPKTIDAFFKVKRIAGGFTVADRLELQAKIELKKVTVGLGRHLSFASFSAPKILCRITLFIALIHVLTGIGKPAVVQLLIAIALQALQARVAISILTLLRAGLFFGFCRTAHEQLKLPLGRRIALGDATI